MTDDISVSSRSMKKWGIPETSRVSNEVTLLERLVWVQYQGHWWPALLYQNYSELQTHLYEQLDMSMKAQFAMAIMKQVQDPKNKFRVARLLGREVLEVVEVKDGQYAEFYWQLSNVMPQACHRSQYGSNNELYIDFHRALDQVEQIIEEISQSKVNLMPDTDKKSWEQRAREALESDLSTSAPKKKASKPSVTKAFESKEAASAAAAALDESFFGGFDSFMTSLSKGVDDFLLGGQPNPSPARTAPTPEAPELAQSRVQYTEARNQVPTQGALYSGGAPLVTSASRRFTSQPRAGSMPPVAPRSKMNRYTTVAPPRYEGYRSTSHPSLDRSSDNSSRAVMDEARDPSNEYYRRRVANSDGNSSKESGSKNQRSVEVLPGLEADDIVPGITETNVWKNVLEHMLISKTGDEEQLEEVSVALQHTAQPLKQHQQQMYHRRMPSNDIQFHEDATVPAVEVAPKITAMKINPSEYSGRSVGNEPSLNPERESRFDDPAQRDYRSDPDQIIAENQPRAPRVESDDSLLGFLLCRSSLDAM